MANTVAHLAVARRILDERPKLVKTTYSYYLGSLAPDTIESKEGAVRDDKKRVHLRLGISDMEWLNPDKMCIFDSRLEDFVREHISHRPAGQQRDFSMGYLVHLLTDKYNHGTVRQRILHALMPRGFEDGTWDFVYEVLNELEALDNYLLENDPDLSALFHSIIEQPVRNCMPGLIESGYMEKSLGWWKDEYIPQIAQRKPRIMEFHEIDEFVDGACKFVLGELDILLLRD